MENLSPNLIHKNFISNIISVSAFDMLRDELFAIVNVIKVIYYTPFDDFSLLV